MSLASIERIAPICGCLTDLPITRGMCRICYQKWLDVTPVDERPPLDKPPPRNFDDYVDSTTTPEGCWPFTAGCAIERGTHGHWSDQGGEGWDGYAHRYALIRATGIEPPGLNALHRCDYPPCCRPSHLYWGTQQDNVNDMIARGRRKVAAPLEVCQRGHDMTGDNAAKQARGRYCKACKVERQAKRERLRDTAVEIAELILAGQDMDDAVDRYRIIRSAT